MADFSQLSLTNDDGKEELFDVLINFTSDEFKKSYLVICPATTTADEGGQVSVTPVSYTADEEGNVTGILEIQTKEEFELVKSKFEELYQAEAADEEGGCCGGHNHDEDHDCCGGHNHDEDHECCGGHDHSEEETK